jgi:phosphoglucosamine mutase
MSRKYFGTDGIRGRANGVITPDLAMKVGMAAGLAFYRGDHRHRVVIGKDTRLSGYMIENALVAGFTSVGMDVLLLGPMPTPAVAMLTNSLRCDIGVMISASHNPFDDNGIKLFGPDGFKLSDEREGEIEKLIDGNLARGLAGSRDLGRARRIDDVRARYIEFAKRTLPRHLRLDGLRVVIDCANGAAYKVAPEALWELGAEVISIGVEPDGYNINKDVGSTSPEALSAKVREVRADIGIALDGDADRVVIVDERGHTVDGDQLMAVVAASWKDDGRLSQPGIVATVMSNLGLERYLGGLGLMLERTAVGDRYVLERMRAQGYNVGGEQSGHIILSDFATTGERDLSPFRSPAADPEERADARRQAARRSQGRHRHRGQPPAPRGRRPAHHPAVRNGARHPRDGRGGRPCARRDGGRRDHRRHRIGGLNPRPSSRLQQSPQAIARIFGGSIVNGS